MARQDRRGERKNQEKKLPEAIQRPLPLRPPTAVPILFKISEVIQRNTDQPFMRCKYDTELNIKYK